MKDNKNKYWSDKDEENLMIWCDSKNNIASRSIAYLKIVGKVRRFADILYAKHFILYNTSIIDEILDDAVTHVLLNVVDKFDNSIKNGFTYISTALRFYLNSKVLEENGGRIKVIEIDKNYDTSETFIQEMHHYTPVYCEETREEKLKFIKQKLADKYRIIKSDKKPLHDMVYECIVEYMEKFYGISDVKGIPLLEYIYHSDKNKELGCTKGQISASAYRFLGVAINQKFHEGDETRIYNEWDWFVLDDMPLSYYGLYISARSKMMKGIKSNWSKYKNKQFKERRIELANKKREFLEES